MTALAEEGLLLGEPPEDEGAWPTTIEWVDVDLIDVDESYQRDQIPAHVRRISERFDRRVFQFPVVSARDDGRYVELDGQQRIAAVRLRGQIGPFRIRCEVHHGLTREEEAEIYLILNSDRVQPTPLDHWKARLKFGDEVAVAITALAEEYEIPIGKTRQGMERLQAVSAVEDIWTNYRRRLEFRGRTNRVVVFREGPEALDRAFAAISRSWRLFPKRYRGEVVAGLGLFFFRFTDEEIDYETLHLTMAQMTPEALANVAMSHMGPSLGLETRRAAYATALANAYNQQAKREGVDPLPVKERFPKEAE